MITGEGGSITCIVSRDTPIDNVVDRTIFGAEPSDSLRSTLERLTGPVETTTTDGVRWFFGTGPRARWETGCVPIRSAGEGACVWQMNAYPVGAQGDRLLHADLVQIVQREAKRLGRAGSINLSIEPSASGPGAVAYFTARYHRDLLNVVEWRDESIPRDFVLPATTQRQGR
jgi:hypothetical protein